MRGWPIFKQQLLLQLLQQQAQPFGMAEGAPLGVGGQVLEAFGHAIEAKLVQQVECRMMKQG